MVILSSETHITSTQSPVESNETLDGDQTTDEECAKNLSNEPDVALGQE